jgi:hypothetical protein
LGQWGDGKVLVDALPWPMAEADFISAGVEVGLELEEVDDTDVSIFGLAGGDGEAVAGAEVNFFVIERQLGAEGEIRLVRGGHGMGLLGGEAGDALAARSDVSTGDAEIQAQQVVADGVAAAAEHVGEGGDGDRRMVG